MKPKPKFGSAKGMFIMGKDFDDPLEDFKEYMYNDDEFSETEMNTLEERKKSRLSGESKGYSWEDAKTIITQTKQ